MERICFIVPNLQKTKKVVTFLEKKGIMGSHVHVLGKHPEKIDHAHLHNAGVLQTTDLIPALKRGALLSVILIACIFALFFFTLPEGVAMTTLAIAGIILFGLAFGLWASAMVGIAIPNKIVDAVKNEIRTGHYLLMVDVPAERVRELSESVSTAYPEIHLATPIEDPNRI